MKKKEANCLSVKKKQIKEAVNVLKEYLKKWDEENPSRKKPLLEEPSQTPILLNFTLKKIPELSKIQMIKVPLPHTMVTDVTEVCLFTGDLDKRDTKADVDPTIQHYKELLSKHGVTTVSEVIPLRQLRTEYRPYEAKRNLYGAYDYFLVDNRISQCLPRILGKFFFKKRKFPQQINLATSNLKYQIENALSRTVFFLTGQGNSCSAEVAHLGFTTEQIIENIEAAINTLASDIPGTWKNINGLYIKTPLSVSIPLYLSSESGNDVELPSPETVEDVEAEELTTLKGYKVKVYIDGNIEIVKTDEDSSDNESDRDYVEKLSKTESLDEDDHKHRKIWKKKTLSDVSDEEEEEDDEEEAESDRKHRKMLKKKKTLSDVSDEEEVEVSKRKEKLKRKVNTEKVKAESDHRHRKMLKKKKTLSDMSDEEEEEVEILSKKKLKGMVKMEKTKAESDHKHRKLLKKKKTLSDVSHEEDEEEISKRKEKLKRKVNTEKVRAVVKKKKKRYMDAVDEPATIITKKKNKVF